MNCCRWKILCYAKGFKGASNHLHIVMADTLLELRQPCIISTDCFIIILKID
uniref:Uncharacterized protein n=1 Tax=Rhizophora mucronata TaxID=61149 RepID=A0A2P2JX34_RHIMU